MKEENVFLLVILNNYYFAAGFFIVLKSGIDAADGELERLKKSVEVRGEIFNPEKYFFPGHSHNLYLTALVERGVVGLMMTFLLMIAWIRQLIKTLDLAKKSSEAMYLWAGSFSAWITTFVIGLVNTTFHHEHAILACLFLGLYLSYTNEFLKKE